ncbi:MAG: aminoacyl-tRNA hydrolase [Bacteroidales bacterium]|nr:aminoacyl-tRNA hydrolase [Bacteroidales bacterium]
MKYLIAGLGNIGAEYENTRHNIGFDVVNFLAKEKDLQFSSDKYVFKTEFKWKGRTLILIKPTTYMNLSGKAVNYWLQKESIPISNLMVVVDDLALPFGTIRIKGKGSDGGHNGLKDIQTMLGHSNYARMRFGIGSEFAKGTQVNYVLGTWQKDEMEKLKEKISFMADAIKTFASIGLDKAMSEFNNK